MLSLFTLQPRVGRQTCLPRGQLDVTQVEILAACLGAAAAIIEWFANLLTSLQHGDRRPFVSLDHAALFGRALVRRLVTLSHTPPGGTYLPQAR